MPTLENETLVTGEPLAVKPPQGGDTGWPDGGGPGRRGGWSTHESGPPIANEKFAMWILLGSLVMLFAGILSGYTVLRFGMAQWPPPGMPALPWARLGLNTLAILGSSVAIQWSFLAIRTGRTLALKLGLAVTTALGLAFLFGQWSAWQGLHLEGLAMSTNTYGALFYTITGLHAAHVVAGVIFLLVITLRAWLGRYTAEKHIGVELCAMYWHFVDLVWLGVLAVFYF